MSITGQLKTSNVSHCPVFIPLKISSHIVTSLAVENEFNVNLRSNLQCFESSLELYFLKFIAGDSNLESGFADIKADDLYLWHFAKCGTNNYCKKVSNTVSRFKIALEQINLIGSLNIDELIKINNLVRPKAKQYGIRQKEIKAGNPLINPNAFYCLPAKKVKSYLSDWLELFNKKSIALNEALMLFLQLTFIHSFTDGNGRLSRLILINKISKLYGYSLASLFVIYLKNIDKKNYHNAIKKYRHGNINSLIIFYQQAIDWTNKSGKILGEFIADYIRKIGDDKFKNDPNYAKIVVKVGKNQVLARIFHRIAIILT